MKTSKCKWMLLGGQQANTVRFSKHIKQTVLKLFLHTFEKTSYLKKDENFYLQNGLKAKLLNDRGAFHFYYLPYK